MKSAVGRAEIGSPLITCPAGGIGIESARARIIVRGIVQVLVSGLLFTA